MHIPNMVLGSIAVSWPVVFIGACGSSSSATGSLANRTDASTFDADADLVPEVRTTEAGDGRGGDAASTGDSSDATAPLSYHGGIEALTQVSSDGGIGYAYSANFATAVEYRPPDAFSPLCSVQVGSCCFVLPQAQLEAGVVIPVGAGDVSLTDHSTTLATLMPATPGYSAYSSVDNPPTRTLIWQPGDALHVGSTGDAVHPFVGSATAGTPLSVISPVLSGTLFRLPLGGPDSVLDSGPPDVRRDCHCERLRWNEYQSGGRTGGLLGLGCVGPGNCSGRDARSTPCRRPWPVGGHPVLSYRDHRRQREHRLAPGFLGCCYCHLSIDRCCVCMDGWWVHGLLASSNKDKTFSLGGQPWEIVHIEWERGICVVLSWLLSSSGSLQNRTLPREAKRPAGGSNSHDHRSPSLIAPLALASESLALLRGPTVCTARSRLPRRHLRNYPFAFGDVRAHQRLSHFAGESG